MAISKITTGSIEDGTLSTADLANSAVTQAKIDPAFVTAITTNPTFLGTGALTLPSGTDGQRPASPVVGMIRFNTTVGVLEQYTNSGWVGIEPAPTISSVTLPSTQTAVLDGDTVTIAGTGFKSGCIVKFIASGGTQYISPTVTFISSVLVTATITNSMPEGVYQLVINNPSGLGYSFDNAFNIDGLPAFTTTSGSLGTISMGTPYSYTIAANEDGSAVTSFTITAGALPSGGTLNSSTGVISGTAPDVEASTTYTFTVQAKDAENQVSTRSFSITVNYQQIYSLRTGY
jgi:hypothetical protein